MIEARVSVVITACNSEVFRASPFEMTRTKFSAVIRSIAVDEMYRSAKQAVRSRIQAGGPQ